MRAPRSVRTALSAAAIAAITAASVGGVGLAVAAPGATPPKNGHKGPPAAAVRLSRDGLLARADLGTGWLQRTTAPAKADALICTNGAGTRAATRNVVVATPSATFAQPSTSTFASSASYVFATVAKQRQAWGAVTADRPGPCLEKRLEQGSSQQVKLTATSVRLISSRSTTLAGVSVTTARWQARAPPRGPGRRFASTWTASSSVPIVGSPRMSSRGRSRRRRQRPSCGSVRAQARRVLGERRASSSTGGQDKCGFGSF